MLLFRWKPSQRTGFNIVWITGKNWKSSTQKIQERTLQVIAGLPLSKGSEEKYVPQSDLETCHLPHLSLWGEKMDVKLTTWSGLASTEHGKGWRDLICSASHHTGISSEINPYPSSLSWLRSPDTLAALSPPLPSPETTRKTLWAATHQHHPFTCWQSITERCNMLLRKTGHAALYCHLDGKILMQRWQREDWDQPLNLTAPVPLLISVL